MVQLSEQQKAILKQLELQLRGGTPVAEAQAALEVAGISSDLISEVVALRQQIIEERIQIAGDRAVTDPEDGPSAWYAGPSEGDLFWPALKQVLEGDPGWQAAVPALDESSTDVVALLDDPHSPVIRTRGLVVGYVQSGKTANFTATIAKAADAGYRLFIVLSGVHNALRRQTQLRLEQQLQDLQPAHWLSLTDENRDFGNPVKALPLVAGTDLRLLAVVKKNVSRLTKLRDWLLAAHEHGGLDNCPVLIIDDEADQASPNAASSPDLDPTKVNDRIRDLLKLPRVAYVGYTATPFANVLINPAEVGDLYPRSFIYSLPKPASYFGAEELFGLGVSEEESPSTGYDMVRFVPGPDDDSEEDEASQYRVQKGVPFQPPITKSLGSAIRWFLLATAARRARSGVSRHSSMLIHTTQRIDPQLAFLPVIRDHLKQLRQEWKNGNTGIWEALWEEERRREPAERHGLPAVEFDRLSSVMGDVLDQVKVVADNSRSDERLIYSDEPVSVIAVGGNTLSRGLTLEGLVCSFFLRTASTYDSLLQMGRWFGYRVGYSDLPRIWTTRDLAEDFRFLSEIEADVRADIDRYAQQVTSPLELAVRMRLHPRMKVVAANKMHFAKSVSASFSGQRPQTTYFSHRDRAIAEANLGAARRLLGATVERGAEVGLSENRVVVKDVPVDDVLGFVESYRFHERSELGGTALRGYIESQVEVGALRTWNVAVITRGDPKRTIDLGLPNEVGLISRSRLVAGSEVESANIGTLMSRPDRVADLLPSAAASGCTDLQLEKHRNDDGRGLLLLYPIDKASEPGPSAKGREDLDAVEDLVGVAFSFPRAVPGSEPTTLDMIAVDPELLALARAADGPADANDESYTDEEGSRDEVDLGDE